MHAHFPLQGVHTSQTHSESHVHPGREVVEHAPPLRMGRGGKEPPGPLLSPPPAEEGDNPLLQLPTPGLGPWQLRPGQGGQELVGYLLNTRCGELAAWPALSVWVVTQIVGIQR